MLDLNPLGGQLKYFGARGRAASRSVPKRTKSLVRFFTGGVSSTIKPKPCFLANLESSGNVASKGPVTLASSITPSAALRNVRQAAQRPSQSKTVGGSPEARCDGNTIRC